MQNVESMSLHKTVKLEILFPNETDVEILNFLFSAQKK